MKKEVNTYKKKFKCVNSDDLNVWGDYNSAKAQQVTVRFNMCENKPICKTKDEIIDWLSGKYIVILYNQIRFD